MVNDLIKFLQRIGTPDALIGVDWVLDHPDAPGVLKAAKIVKRILGVQRRGSAERVLLIDRICYREFPLFPEAQRQWVRRYAARWIRAVFEGQEIDLPPGRMRLGIQDAAVQYLNECTHIHGPDIIRLIQDRRAARRR